MQEKVRQAELVIEKAEERTKTDQKKKRLLKDVQGQN